MPQFNPPNYKAGDRLLAADLQAIVDEIKRVGGFSGSGSLQVRRGSHGLQFSFAPETIHYVAQSHAITAMSGTTFGSGTVDVYWADATGNAAAVGMTLNVLNFSHTAIPSGKNCFVSKDAFGRWWITSVEC